MLWHILASLQLHPACQKGAGIPEVLHLICQSQMAQVVYCISCGMRCIRVGKQIFPSKTTAGAGICIVDTYI